MFDYLGMTALLAVAAVGVWLALRARRARHRVVKCVGLVLSSLIALVGSLATGVALVGFYRLNDPPSLPKVTDIKVAGTPDQVARGARFSVKATSSAVNSDPSVNLTPGRRRNSHVVSSTGRHESARPGVSC